MIKMSMFKGKGLNLRAEPPRMKLYRTPLEANEGPLARNIFPIVFPRPLSI